MEDQRSMRSGSFGVGPVSPTGRRASRASSLPPLSFTATLSVGLLMVVLAWSVSHELQATGSNPPVAAQEQTGADEAALPAIAPPAALSQSATSSQDLSDFGAQVVGVVAAQYDALQQQDAYSPQAGAAIASQLAPIVKTPVHYPTFSIADLSITSDTSAARVIKYQADLRAALAPLSQNTTPEISIFAAYTQTKDAKYLDQLRSVAALYAQAASAAARVQVPADAISAHVGILNAMEEFSAILEALADNAQDPMATMGILNTYNDAESNMVVSFNTFALYIQKHTTS